MGTKMFDVGGLVVVNSQEISIENFGVIIILPKYEQKYFKDFCPRP